MKILYICKGDSIHSARWINQISNNHQISVASINSISLDNSYYQNNVVIFNLIPTIIPNLDTNKSDIRIVHIIKALINIIARNLVLIYLHIDKTFVSRKVLRYIESYKPDIIHSLEIQSAGYLVNEARNRSNTYFPTWIVSNWGSDIYHFGKDPYHARKIREVLNSCDYYLCECQRDVVLAQNFGFKGKVLSVLPNAGGYKITKYLKYCKSKPSQRKFIMIKGYQGWAGRSLIALEALDSIGKILFEKKYGLILYSMAGNIEVENKAIAIAKKHNLKLERIPQFSNHNDIIRLHAKSRISIGLSVSDGISTSLLESMLTGSFPIQSYTACADEWVVDNHTGLLVSPEDVEEVKMAILKGITDDDLVDKAAVLNFKTIKERANYNTIRKQVIQLYNTVMNERIKK